MLKYEFMKEGEFKIQSEFKPSGGQPQSIEALTNGVIMGAHDQTLMGVTGSGKTFVISNVIANIQKPTLVIAHNKTLAAQLASEFRAFFPNNAVAYFVSYYDYYQPEAYIPTTDVYIEKETQINEEIEKYRNSATQYLLSRKDVIIVSSVSCIYGLGDPSEYEGMAIHIKKGTNINRKDFVLKLGEIQYVRNDIEYERGTFRARGDMIEIFPAYMDTTVRIELLNDLVETIKEINPFNGKTIRTMDEVYIYPAKHYVADREKMNKAIVNIREELKERILFFKKRGMLLEAQRIEQRTNFDLEMIEELGYCSGIENYSRQIEGRAKGSPPFTLIDFFPKDFLLVIDESHITIPQIKGMYNGDFQRKKTLVDYGFRLPSAMDNRPLKYEEFRSKLKNVIYTSATPNEYELSLSINATRGIKGYPKNGYVEQVIRPTGLTDPEIEVRKTKGQIEDIQKEIQNRVKNKERTLILTLTKRMAEELNTYLESQNIKTQYLHSEIDTIERTEILRSLRLGEYDVIVGINLLREGIDLPEVSLIIILDADKEGFLRSKQSLIQMIGRAARNVNGKVIMYADNITQSMKEAIEETNRRRNIQIQYNKENNITPKTILKNITVQLEKHQKLEENNEDTEYNISSDMTKKEILKELQKEMENYAKKMQFEKAAKIRDKIKEIKSEM